MLNVCFEIVDRQCTAGFNPRSGNIAASLPQCKVIALTVGAEYLILGTLVGIETVAVTEFKETKVGKFAADIALETLETTKKECLAKHVKVVAQRVHQTHKILALVYFEAIVVGSCSERVIHNLVETTTHELLRNKVLQFVRFILGTLGDD